jgi:hypothetical protein
MPGFQGVQEVLRRFNCIADQAGKRKQQRCSALHINE